jgi:hypothetical protein
VLPEQPADGIRGRFEDRERVIDRYVKYGGPAQQLWLRCMHPSTDAPDREKGLSTSQHLDEFNYDIGSHQELIAPAGTHKVTVTLDGKELSFLSSSATPARLALHKSGRATFLKDWFEVRRDPFIPKFAEILQSPIAAPRRRPVLERTRVQGSSTRGRGKWKLSL